MSDVIKQDLYRYLPKPYNWSVLIKGLMKSQGFRFMYLLRQTASTKRNSITYYFFKLLLRHFMFKYGFQIPANTKIGHGFYIGHFGTIIISVNAIIGNNCNISPGVTIGRDHRGERNGSPRLGDNVWLGTNSVLVGKISVGSDVLIAPNSFVNFDVPDHSIVIGNPAKIIPRENATEGYINNIMPEL